jgi:hypothetical protein
LNAPPGTRFFESLAYRRFAKERPTGGSEVRTARNAIGSTFLGDGSRRADTRPRAKWIREGLRLLEEREQTREAAVEELRAQLRRGVELADGGELLDGDAVI